MFRFAYPALVRSIGSEFLVTFRDIPEAVSAGWTRDDALKMASNALAAALSEYVENEQEPPAPTPPHVHEVFVRVPAAIAAGLLLRREVLRRKMADADVAGLIGREPAEVSRMLAGQGSMDDCVSALEAMGLQLQVTVTSDDQAPSKR